MHDRRRLEIDQKVKMSEWWKNSQSRCVLVVRKLRKIETGQVSTLVVVIKQGCNLHANRILSFPRLRVNTIITKTKTQLVEKWLITDISSTSKQPGFQLFEFKFQMSDGKQVDDIIRQMRFQETSNSHPHQTPLQHQLLSGVRDTDWYCITFIFDNALTFLSRFISVLDAMGNFLSFMSDSRLFPFDNKDNDKIHSFS